MTSFGREGMDARRFPTVAVASLSTGVLLCDFRAVQEVAEYVMGHPIWTHHFVDAALWQEIQRAIIDQCPGMPTEIPADANSWDVVLAIEEKIGRTISIRRGSGLTALLPSDGIPDHLNNNRSSIWIDLPLSFSSTES
jgi:hypothetical protein